MAEPNFKNRTLFHGDNLEFLRGMNSETVHLIATDPPFNKNRDFHATPDSLASGARFKDRWRWDKDAHDDWQDSIKDDWPAAWEVITAARAAYGDDMGAFLCWLGVRLMEMRRVLRADGSIYLHIDHTAHAYVKCLMDAIFGWKNFRNEIVWWYKNASRGKKQWAKSHDTILWYSKNHSAYLFNREAVLVPFESKMTQWRYERGGQKGKAMPRGKTPDDVILMPSLNTMDKERTGYPTQKPLALYERIIRASSNEGDIVLDPFCGCATTPVAAERLKRQWVGIDIWDGAYKQVIRRMERDTILRANDRSHVVLPLLHYEIEPPLRTDDKDMAAPSLRLKIQRPEQPWQKISHRGMMNILAAAQQSPVGIVCAGCGRVLEREFMQLDHILPKAEGGANHILNRILLCGPCNRRKRNYLTLAGLRRENKKKSVGWMKNESQAKRAQVKARDKAEWARDSFAKPECQALIKG